MKIFYDAYDEDNPKGSHSTNQAWPKKGDRLLKEPGESTPKEVSAHLDWLRTFSDDLDMPDAYKLGGDFLVESLRLGGDGTHPDAMTFPILYLYRHAVELRLKEMVRLGIRLQVLEQTESINDLLSRHALYPLWSCVRSVLEFCYPNGDKRELSAVESMIQELHRTDHDGQKFRYARSNDGQKYEYDMPDQIDLLHLRTTFKGLWHLLDGSLCGLLEAEANMPSMDDYY